MGKICIKIDEALDKKFRERIYEKYGMKRGNFKKAVEEAITKWIDLA